MQGTTTVVNEKICTCVHWDIETHFLDITKNRTFYLCIYVSSPFKRHASCPQWVHCWVFFRLCNYQMQSYPWFTLKNSVHNINYSKLHSPDLRYTFNSKYTKTSALFKSLPNIPVRKALVPYIDSTSSLPLFFFLPVQYSVCRNFSGNFISTTFFYASLFSCNLRWSMFRQAVLYLLLVIWVYIYQSEVK